MTSVVRLSVHKNTAKQRKAASIRRGLRNDARELSASVDISGYVIYAWNSTNKAVAYYCEAEDMNALPHNIEATLRNALSSPDGD